MQKKHGKQSLSLLVCSVLLAATALLTTGCSSAESTASAAPSSTASTSEAAPAATASAETAATTVGQGATTFTFTVVDGDGKETVYDVHTDQTTVGEALQELGLIEGEESEYGLYVKTVNGITVDYDTDGKYWAFYVDGAYAQAGVDATQITPGASYAFRVE